MGLRDAEAELAPYITNENGVRYLHVGRLRSDDPALYMRLYRNGVPGTNGIELICRHLGLTKTRRRPGPKPQEETDIEAITSKAAARWIDEQLQKGLTFAQIACSLNASVETVQQLHERSRPQGG